MDHGAPGAGDPETGACGALQLSLFDQQDLAEITHPDYPGERLIVCNNPLLAVDRARKRQELLAATESDLARIAAATSGRRGPCGGGRDWAPRRQGAGPLQDRQALHDRHTDRALRYQRDEAAIDAEAALDGIYVIRTNVPAAGWPASETVRAYKRLAEVERAFRSLKTVDLHVRPIHHRTADRVRAHVFFCMLAYYVEWHMRQTLAPLLFDDDDKAAARHSAPRSSRPRSARRGPKRRPRPSGRRRGCQSIAFRRSWRIWRR